MEFEDFVLPFSGKLRSDNRWVKLAKFIPWDEFESAYSKSLGNSSLGPPAKSVRIALGALIIKERLGSTDEETVEQIRENPYLQYFLGYKEYKDEQPFDPSLFVYFRKRFRKETLSDINESIVRKALNEEKKRAAKKSPKDSDDDPGSSSNSNRGKLIVDATCTPADITFPTDLKLLNTAREKNEEIIDILHRPFRGKHKKPRTYRKRARKDFLAAAKSKRLSQSKRRKALRKQLGCLERNLKIIDKLCEQTSLLELAPRQYKNLLVIHEVYRQQKRMYDHRERRIDDRIVSVSQPHVRPIKRGKAGAATEFGAKVSLSLINGFSFVDRISWDAYNESGDLIGQIEAYRQRFGHFPESVHADQIYRNRNNRRYCKKYGIRLSGPPLGRPPANPEKQRKVKLQTRQDELDRIAIEGKFGQGKRRFSLARVMCKLALTSETAITVAFLVMNLEKWLRSHLFYLFSVVRGRSFSLSGLITADLMSPKGISSYYRNMGKCICQM
ncbi:MAG: Transposase DDE domain protein [Candidatus Argoarchaeum ethanivorans]|uniref:Transposase DDE domain protein n=1 Tax=Candidatus Argoarchaeum ethanivorans TaxID=2608793 RepID=A0A812A0R7_9EURY|nr:MAG: Transposase DDE domain protein [Candidatus Argoarchaeum ethanivorans]